MPDAVDSADSAECDAIAVGGGCLSGHAATFPCDSDSSSSIDDSDSGTLAVGGCGCGHGGHPVFAVVLLAVALLRRKRSTFALLALLLAPLAHALDAQPLDPADGGPTVALDDADLGEAWSAGATLTTAYARHPVMLRSERGRIPLLSSVFTVQASARLNLFGFLRLGFSIPTHVGVVLDGEPIPYVPGDVSVRASIPLLQCRHIPWCVSWTVQADVPRGGLDSLLGDPGAIVGRVAASGHTGVVDLAANLALRLQRADSLAGVPWGKRLEYGIAATRAFHRLDAGVELFGSTPLQAHRAMTVGEFPLELLGNVGVRLVPGVRLRVGAGAGLTAGVSAPRWRVLAQLDLGSNVAHDLDGDRIADIRDLCLRRPEDRDHHADQDGCPDLDNDHDGFLDPVDHCPDDPERPNGWHDDDGCPDRLADVRFAVVDRQGAALPEATLTRDGDDTAILDDHLILLPGEHVFTAVSDGYRSRSTQPTLVEGPQTVTLVLDPLPSAELDLRLTEADGSSLAGWARVAGVTEDVPEDGALLLIDAGPTHVEVGAKGHAARTVAVEIAREERVAVTVALERLSVYQDDDYVLLRDPVHFALDSARLTPDADQALDALAAWLLAHPEVLRLRIEGHADEIGSSRYNYDLSWRRARSVVDFLVSKGVAADRLEALGTGEAALSPDKESRRVSFLVVIWSTAEQPEVPVSD